MKSIVEAGLLILCALVRGAADAAMGNDNLGDVLENKIGRSAFVALGCQGTLGKINTNSIARIDANGLPSMRDGATTAFGGTEGVATVSRVTSTATGLNLLGRLITVGAAQIVAQSSLQNGVATGPADRSGFTGLTVADVTISIDGSAEHESTPAAVRNRHHKRADYQKRWQRLRERTAY